MNNIIYDDKIITPQNDVWEYYYNNFINRLDKRDCVKLGLFCLKTINPNTTESNDCVRLIKKWLVDKKSVTSQELYDIAHATWSDAYYVSDDAPVDSNTSYVNDASITVYAAAYAVYYASVDTYATTYTAYYAATAATAANAAAAAAATAAIANINKYLQVLLRKTKQFQNNKVLEQISKTDVDKLELVDWNMITDIIQEEYNIVHEFEYKDIFSRRCLIELLRREYT